MYRSGIHARSRDSQHHPSRDWVKALHGTICNDILAGWRFCGENVYAKHSVGYEELPSYFLLFSIWSEENEALSWDETQEWAELLGLETPPVLFEGKWDQKAVEEIVIDREKQEGYVVRMAGRFPFDEFRTSIAKWVRKGHVQTDQHWMHAEIVPNVLAETDADVE